MNHLLILVILTVSSVAFSLKKSEVTAITKEVETLLRSEKEVLRNGVGYYPMIANAVRLSFHDCVGGCDGCVDLKNSENKGLNLAIDALKKLHGKANVVGSKKISDVMSRADLYALAAIVAVKQAASNSPCRGPFFCTRATPQITFRYGRKDGSCSKLPERVFPSANDGFNKTMRFFFKEFGFTWKETTALMGVHSLGRAVGENSGFRGPWVRRLGALNNEYYRDLSQKSLDWKQVEVNRRLHLNQWTHGGQIRGSPMMLNSDMCLMKNIKTGSFGRTTCTYNGCPDSPTAKYVRSYATDNTLWTKDFSLVFQKLIEHKAKNLRHPDTA